ELSQGLARGSEFCRMAELGEVTRADGVVGVRSNAGQLAQRHGRVVVLSPPPLPELHGGQGAQRPQLAHRAPPPIGKLHVHVGEVDQLHAARSATASIPSPPSASSILSTRKPTDSSSERSWSGASRPYQRLTVRQRSAVIAHPGLP